MQHLHALLAVPGAEPNTPAFAAQLDALLGPSRRAHFLLPQRAAASTPAPAAALPQGQPLTYLCGNSLGLQPARCATYLAEELSRWATLGVEGHFTGARPWMTIDEAVAAPLAALVGAASPSEVVAMGTLTSNLHHLLCAFYRPAGARTRILLEAGAFPSDAHVAASQAQLHGLDPAATLLRLSSTRTEEVLAAIAAAGDTLALVMLPGVQYYTGHLLDVRAITAAAHGVGAVVGWDLAHAIGNTPLALHEWGVDFAAWCSYKYLNSGPGGIAGVYVHERHGAGGAAARFRLAGWWGHSKGDRFDMREDFCASPGAQGYQMSNPSVLTMTALRASLDEFEAAGGLGVLRERSLALTGYLEALLLAGGLFGRGGGGAAAAAAAVGRGSLSAPGAQGVILTPADPEQRGAQLSLAICQDPGCPTLDDLCACLRADGVVVDERKPCVIRVAPAPLYNTAEDVLYFVQALERAQQKCIREGLVYAAAAKE